MNTIECFHTKNFIDVSMYRHFCVFFPSSLFCRIAWNPCGCHLLLILFCRSSMMMRIKATLDYTIMQSDRERTMLIEGEREKYTEKCLNFIFISYIFIIW